MNEGAAMDKDIIKDFDESFIKDIHKGYRSKSFDDFFCLF